MATIYFDDDVDRRSKSIQMAKGTTAVGNTVTVPFRAFTFGTGASRRYELSVAIEAPGNGRPTDVRAVVLPSSITFPVGFSMQARNESTTGTMNINITALPEAVVGQRYTIKIFSKPTDPSGVETGIDDNGNPIISPIPGNEATLSVEILAAGTQGGTGTFYSGNTGGSGGGGGGGGGTATPVAPQPGADIPFNMLFVKGIIPQTVIANSITAETNSFIGGVELTILEANSTQIYRINSLSVSPNGNTIGYGGGQTAQEYIPTGFTSVTLFYNGSPIAVIPSLMNVVPGFLRYSLITKNDMIYVMPNGKLTIRAESNSQYTVICSYDILQY